MVVESVSGNIHVQRLVVKVWLLVADGNLSHGNLPYKNVPLQLHFLCAIITLPRYT